MQAFFEAALDPDVRATISATARAAGVDRRNWSYWRRKRGFSRWFQGQWKVGRVDVNWIVDKIGVEKARKDFRYWDRIQQKYEGEGGTGGDSGLCVIVRAPRPEREAGEGTGEAGAGKRPLGGEKKSD